MSTYKEETAAWIDKALALPAGIALMPTPKVDLESVALGVFVVLACIAMLFVLRSGWLVTLLTTCKFHWCVAASAAMGALFGKHDWLVSMLSWAMLAAGAWLALLLTLVVTGFVARIVLWPVLWLARQIDFKSARRRGGSYASPSPRRYTAPAPRSYNAPAGYAAGAAAGYAGAQVWGDMHDPMNAAQQAQQQAQQLAQMQETQRMSPAVNTNGISMSSSGSGIDDMGHAYGDPAPVFEPAPVYDYSSSNCGGGGSCGGGFDF